MARRSRASAASYPVGVTMSWGDAPATCGAVLSGATSQSPSPDTNSASKAHAEVEQVSHTVSIAHAGELGKALPTVGVPCADAITSVPSERKT